VKTPDCGTKTKLVLPLCVLAFAVFSEYSGLDVAWERLFYNGASHSWPLQSNFITAGILHKGGQDFVIGTMVAVFAVFALSFFVKRLRRCRKGAAYLFVGSLISPAIIAIIKSCTHIYMPSSLEIFGGDKPHIRLFDSAPLGLPVGHAFPGAHSSSGFAFLTLYFLLSFYRPKYRYYGLAFGLGLGAVFSITQELRGEHFLSHDLISLVICWYCAWAVFWLMFCGEMGECESPGGQIAACRE
jgi:membrane-associated PAP2 superfamily phosphatase